MNRARGIVMAVLLLVPLSAPRAATRTAAFAPADPGVRAAAMGGAYSAVGGEPSALYWNPATLFYQTGRGFEASYANLYGLGLARRTFITFGTKSVYEVPRFVGERVEVTRDMESGPAYAFGIQSLSLDIGDEGYSEMSVGGGAAWGYSDRVAVGVSLRALFVSSDLHDVSAKGYALGFGAAYRYSSHERLAVAVPNLFTRLFWKFDTTERLPLGVNLGWTRSFGSDLVLSAETEWREQEEGPYRIAVGGEWWVFPARLALRAGFRHVNGALDDIDKPTFGVGVRFSRLRFDYAFRLGPDALGDTHRLGLLAGF